MNTKKMSTKKMVVAALFLAMGMILPMITMQIPAIGNMLLPMHIPVLLCGFVCGAPYGAIIGFVLPLLRSIVFGMPVMMPTAVSMAVELMVYGLASGVLYRVFKAVRGKIYISLVITMLLGRISWGIVSWGLYALLGSEFSWKIFVTQAFANSVPGIIIQFILVPVIVVAVEKQYKEGKYEGKVDNKRHMPKAF